MITFFKVTELLFSSIQTFLDSLFLTTSSLLSSISLLLCVVLVINICNKGATKKFFVNNKKFICITLVIQGIACLISTDDLLVKANAIVLIVCLLIILYKGIVVKTKTKPESKKEVQQEVVDVEVKKKERKKKNESI